MAGLGFKDFQVGEVLTAADVDGYLMQQSVMRFADSAARGSALGTAVGSGVPLAEGMISYLDDQNRVEYFTSTDWMTVGPFFRAIASGTATVVAPGGPGVSDVTVTFPAGRFVSAPIVLCSFNEGTNVNDQWGEGALGSFSVTSSGFTLRRVHSSGDAANSYGAMWLAVEF